MHLSKLTNRSSSSTQVVVSHFSLLSPRKITPSFTLYSKKSCTKRNYFAEINTNFFIIQKRFRRKWSRRLFSQFGLTKFSKCELCMNLQKSREWRKLRKRQQFLQLDEMFHSFTALCSQNTLCFSTEPPLSDYVSKHIKLSGSCCSCPDHQGADLCQLQRTLLFRPTM